MTVFALVLGTATECALAQSATAGRSIPADGGFTIDTAWFDGRACGEGNGRHFFFQIGNGVFSVETGRIARGLLKGSPLITQKPGGQITAQVPHAAGCKSDPLRLAQVEIAAEISGVPFLVLAETPERTDRMSPVAKYIRHLSATGACRTTGVSGLGACSGSRTAADGKKIAITFAIVLQGETVVDFPASGIPIHARCEDSDGRIGCYVGEELENNVTVKAPIEAKALAPETIRSLHDKLVDYANGIRVR